MPLQDGLAALILFALKLPQAKGVALDSFYVLQPTTPTSFESLVP